MKDFLLRRKLKKYEQNVNAHVNDPVYLQELASLYQRSSDQDAAITYYQKAIEAYYQDDSRLGVNNEFILQLCWTLLELDPRNALAYQTLGQEYCSLGEFEEAAQLYKSFAAKLAKAGQHDEAISQYRNVLVLFPDDIKTRQSCFSLLWKRHLKEEAVQELKKIAEIAESKGYIAKAVQCYQKALKIKPSDTEFQQELRRLIQTHRRGNNQLRLVVNNDA
jgi:tetratricopeptide (TPR) repeat protein